MRHVWGDDASPPLVLLHGGSGSWSHWIRNVQAFAAAGRRVVVPDLPGFGDSAAPEGVRDADGMVEPMAQSLRNVAGEGPHDLVGFSFGGMLSVMIAAAHPQLVRHLVIVGAPGFGLRDKRLKLFDWRHLDTADKRAEVHRRNLGILMLHDPAAIDDLAVHLQAQNVGRDRMRRRSLAMTDIVKRTLPRLQCRFDAVYGEHDALYDELMPELTAVIESMPNKRELVFIPRAGHWVQYEQAEAFNEAVLGLLSRP
ncbi:alpha/beta fold hydrolase [Ramlibacter albus]|uniref:alpha/beta fold hydrolase n=1 Tax=Ramlibacter albus TaxID=2079448 RepID=UPI00338E61C4